MAVNPADAIAIGSRKAQYGRFADTKQWEKFKTFALPDAVYRYYDTNGKLLQAGNKKLEFTSTASLAVFYTRFFSQAQTLHNFGPGDFEKVGPDEIKVIWALEDQVIVRGTAGLLEIRGGGYYHETWQRKDGEWFLKTLDMYRTYQKVSFLMYIVLLITGLLGLSLV
jgi:hypothetical protein